MKIQLQIALIYHIRDKNSFNYIKKFKDKELNIYLNVIANKCKTQKQFSKKNNNII